MKSNGTNSEELKISVIIPLYNGSDKIMRALQELDQQSFAGEYEVIVVDDKSTDDSLRVVQEGIRQLTNAGHFRVIASPENGRAGKARNTGVREARGEYILFIDQDDYPDRKMLEVLYNLTEDGKFDCTACDILDRNGHKYHRAAAGRISRMKDEDRTNLMFQGFGYVFAMLIRRSIVTAKELLFPEKLMFEDILYNFGVLGSVESINTTNQVLYYRADDENSQTAAFTIRKLKDRVQAAIWYTQKYAGTEQLKPCMAAIYQEAFYYIYLSCVGWAIQYKELYDPQFFQYCVEEGRKLPIDWDQILRTEKRFTHKELMRLKAVYEQPRKMKWFQLSNRYRMICLGIGNRARGIFKK